MAKASNFAKVQHRFNQTVNKGHGRLEIRRHWLIDEPKYLCYLEPKGRWKGLQSIGVVQAERHSGQDITHETRYYLLSFAGNAKTFAEVVRGHWGIENSVHWVLDVTFRGAASRVRAGHDAEHLAILHHVALNLLRQEQTAPVSIRAKRLKLLGIPIILARSLLIKMRLP